MSPIRSAYGAWIGGLIFFYFVASMYWQDTDLTACVDFSSECWLYVCVMQMVTVAWSGRELKYRSEYIVDVNGITITMFLSIKFIHAINVLVRTAHFYVIEFCIFVVRLNTGVCFFLYFSTALAALLFDLLSWWFCCICLCCGIGTEPRWLLSAAVSLWIWVYSYWFGVFFLSYKCT